jgi:hypothetical protein
LLRAGGWRGGRQGAGRWFGTQRREIASLHATPHGCAPITGRWAGAYQAAGRPCRLRRKFFRDRTNFSPLALATTTARLWRCPVPQSAAQRLCPLLPQPRASSENQAAKVPGGCVIIGQAWKYFHNETHFDRVILDRLPQSRAENNGRPDTPVECFRGRPARQCRAHDGDAKQ